MRKQHKKSTSFRDSLCVGSCLFSRDPIASRRQPSIFAASALNAEKEHLVSRCSLCVGSYLFSRAVASQVSSARQSLTSVFGMVCWQLPIFPGRRQPSIFGTTELNFCVRNGNRWTLCVKGTNLQPSERVSIENRIRSVSAYSKSYSRTL